MGKPYEVSVERKTILMCEPHLIAFSHILKHEYASAEQEAQGIIACTDGDHVWYGTKYGAMQPPERAYVCVHEFMHGIFMHADRAVLLRLMRGTLNPALFNYAGDAIINEGIESNPVMPSGMFMPPKDFPPVKMAFIHKAIKEAIDKTGYTPPSNYDPKIMKGVQVETIYDWLMWALDAVNRWRREQEKNCPRAQQKQEQSQSGQKGRMDEDKQKGDQSDKDDGTGGQEDGDQNGQDDGTGGQEDGDQDGQGDGDQNGQGAQDSDADGGSSGSGGGKCDPNGSPSQKPCTCGRCDNEGQGGAKGGGTAMGEGSNDKNGQGSGVTQIESMARETAWDLEERLDRLRELLDKGVTTTELIDRTNDRINEARVRIEKVVQGLKLQGRGQGSLLLELAADMPRSVIPWNRILRKNINRGLGTRLSDSYVRYGSPTMTALARGQRVVPFSPGTTIFSERPRVLVILDVSGSHIGMLPVCFAEIWSIAQMKGAIVEVMTFDDGVQEVLEIKNKQDFNTILRRGIRGGGGTTLQGVWDRIAKMRDPYRMCVVMTDGYLSSGKKPKIPVTWLVTPGGNKEFNYGEVIVLPQVMAKAA